MEQSFGWDCRSRGPVSLQLYVGPIDAVNVAKAYIVSRLIEVLRVSVLWHIYSFCSLHPMQKNKFCQQSYQWIMLTCIMFTQFEGGGGQKLTSMLSSFFNLKIQGASSYCHHFRHIFSEEIKTAYIKCS